MLSGENDSRPKETTYPDLQRCDSVTGPVGIGRSVASLRDSPARADADRKGSCNDALMESLVRNQEYELRFGPGEKRIAFRASGIVRALIRAEDMLQAGQVATLLEDGVPICSLSTNGFFMFPKHCKPVAEH